MPDSLDKAGFDELRAALRDAPDTVLPIARRAMDDSLRFVIAILRPYPPQPSRSRADRFNTYVRGIGHFPLASFEEGGRKKRGAYKEGARGGRVRRTSERMGEKWTYEVRSTDGGLEGILGNTASYSDVVQGQKRPPFHRRTGWVTWPEALIQAEPQILRRFEQATDELLEALANE